MFSYVIRKMRNKRWLNLCLLAGILLFSAVFVCHPMFEKGAENKILQDLFTGYAEKEQRYPAVLSYASGSGEEFHSLQEAYNRMDALKDDWQENVDAGTISVMQYISLPAQNGNGSLGGRNWMLSAANLRDLEEHIQVVKGWEQPTDADVFPCSISESTMDTYGIAVGEEIEFSNLTDAGGSPARFVVRDIFAMRSETDPYWYKTPAEFDHMLFVEPDVLDALLSEYGIKTLSFEEHLLVDHTDITWRNAGSFRDYISRAVEEDHSFSSNLSAILESYEEERRNASVILWVLELPCLVLLLLFIYMVSSRILMSEESEMAVFRSRGVSRRQVLLLYLLQSGILSLAGSVLGIGAGFILCRAAAGTDSFLSFTGKDTGLYGVNEWMIPYAAAAGMIAMIFMAVPAWRRSAVTIVQQKKNAAAKEKRPVWERCFLDFLLLALSLYLLYNYEKQSALWDADMSSGRMDPLVFLNASLFTFALALLLIRLSKYMMRLIWWAGRRHWRPALYASFLEMMRTFSKRSFLAVFLIMTVGNGIFDANIARTMNQNGVERLRYNAGCDVRLQQAWEKKYFYEKGELKGYYQEPDFGTYADLKAEGLCRGVTRVMVDQETTVYGAGKNLPHCTLMGIHTREFGETAELLDGINEKHWFHALNELAAQADGVIISRNMAEKLGLTVGDTIRYARFLPFGDQKEDLKGADGHVCAIVDGFPSFDPYTGQQEGYLLVANYAEIAGQFEPAPYQVWMRLADGVRPEQIRDELDKKKVVLEFWQSLQKDLEERQSSPLIQITNGLFTMNFLISLLICSVGFLIYWIMSIRSREQLFGIYRAMGMRMSEIIRMLLNEQFFGSLIFILSGAAAGIAATGLFTGLTALVYLPEKHIIGIRIFRRWSDMARITVVLGAVMLICLLILWQIIKRMKIAQTLRMGEEE